MNAMEAHEFASQRAADEPGWNKRYIEGLRLCGYTLLAWPEKQQRPPGTIDAPLPVPDGTDMWPVPSIIVPMIGEIP